MLLLKPNTPNEEEQCRELAALEEMPEAAREQLTSNDSPKERLCNHRMYVLEHFGGSLNQMLCILWTKNASAEEILTNLGDRKSYEKEADYAYAKERLALNERHARVQSMDAQTSLKRLSSMLAAQVAQRLKVEEAKSIESLPLGSPIKLAQGKAELLTQFDQASALIKSHIGDQEFCTQELARLRDLTAKQYEQFDHVLRFITSQ
jgi:hypothetical protein